MWTYMPRAVRGTVSRDTTTVLRRMFHVLILNVDVLMCLLSGRAGAGIIGGGAQIEKTGEQSICARAREENIYESCIHMAAFAGQQQWWHRIRRGLQSRPMAGERMARRHPADAAGRHQCGGTGHLQLGSHSAGRRRMGLRLARPHHCNARPCRYQRGSGVGDGERTVVALREISADVAARQVRARHQCWGSSVVERVKPHIPRICAGIVPQARRAVWRQSDGDRVACGQ